MVVCRKCPSTGCLSNCRLASSAYCGYCGMYGHFAKYCKHHVTIVNTPITPKKLIFDSDETPRQLSICKSEKGVRAFLYFYKLSVCQRMESNLKNIKKYCKERGWHITFIEPAEYSSEE